MEQSSQAFVLCGGIGAGKSYVSAHLESAGVEMIEADRVGHEILLPGGAAFAAVAARWPQVLEHGLIDRKKLGAIVFHSPDELAVLESMTHPAIAKEIAHRISASSSRFVGVERPFLDGLVGQGLPVVVVDAPDDLRAERLRNRGLTDEEISSRMAAQPGRDAWLEQADFVIDNGNDADVVSQVAAGIRWLESFVTGTG
jgi:dephospho-CoA kinase